MRLSGERIVLIRLKKGLTLQALSKISGVSPGTIQRLEKGKATPRPITVKALCDALNVPFEELFEIRA